MNLDKKLELSQEILLKLLDKAFSPQDIKNSIELSWVMADAMEAEYHKRNATGLSEVLQDDFQIDWSVAPDGYNWWAEDEYGSWWFDQEPKWVGGEWGGYVFNKHNRSATEKAPSFNYQGNWKDSLRKRPQEKPKQHQCNCAHWKGSSFFMGDTFTCNDCGGWVTI